MSEKYYVIEIFVERFKNTIVLKQVHCFMIAGQVNSVIHTFKCVVFFVFFKYYYGTKLVVPGSQNSTFRTNI